MGAVTVNNFDMSSSGVNLSLLVYRDNVESQERFDENFTRMEHATDFFQFVNYGNFKARELDDINSYAYRRRDLTSALLALENISVINEWSNNIYSKCYSKLRKSEAADLLFEVANTLLMPEDIVSLYREHLTPKFQEINIHGFCQGDSATVIFFADDMVAYGYGCKSGFLPSMTKLFEDLFYRAPVTFSLDVDGEDVSDGIELDDDYAWSRSEFVKKSVLAVSELNLSPAKEAYVERWLLSSTPDDPCYMVA